MNPTIFLGVGDPMTDLSFGRVKTCLFDPAYMNRQSTLGALQTLGFKEVEPVSRLRDLETALGAGGFHLLIAELQGQDDEICDVIRRMRHRQVGPDPFLVTILTTWDLNADVVRAVVNCGADDLLARPYTIAQIRQRVTGVTLQRKPFVVTADYVGPSRRTAVRAPEEGEIFQVPNSLRVRTTGDAEECGPDALAQTWNRVLLWKATRLGRQLEATARMLSETMHHSGAGPGIASMVERLVALSTDLLGYAQQTADPAYLQVADDCSNLNALLAKKGASREAEIRKAEGAARGIAEAVRQLKDPVVAAAKPMLQSGPAGDASYVLI